MKHLLLTLLVLIPAFANAGVSITEVAWMGSVDSANHEWIELYNDGEDTSVDGWTLGDGNSLDIDLAGTIPAGEFVVLERTSDASAAGAAFVVYTGALVNGGTTLTLRDDTGSVIDQVVGGTDWERIGGNNETKDTAQKAASGWITAVPTPGQGSTGIATPAPLASADTTDSVSQTTSDNSSNNRTTYRPNNQSEAITLTLPDVTLQLDVVAPAFSHVNQAVDFSVTPSDVGDVLTDSLTYTWNFGDGTIGSGADPTHRYTHPGSYVVVVAGGYKRQQQVTRFEIEIVAPEISLVRQSEFVEIWNDGTHEIDVSQYRLLGRSLVQLPEYTIILPGQRIAIPKQQLGLDTSNQTVALFDQINQMVAHDISPAQTPSGIAELSEPSEPVLSILDAPLIRPTVTPVPAGQPVVTRSTSDRFMFAKPASVRPSADGVNEDSLFGTVALAADSVATATQVAALTDTATNGLPERWPLYALAVLLVLGILSVYLIPTHPGGKL